MPSGHPLPEGNESCQNFTKRDDLFLECIIEMNKGEAQVLAPVFIIVASITSGTTFTKELGHLDSNLKHRQWNRKLGIRHIGMNTLVVCCTMVRLSPTLVSMSTSLGITSPSPSGSTKLVAFPKFPTLPVRPAYKTI